MSLVTTTAPGSQSSQVEKIRIRKMPLANSGVAVATRLPIDSSRSINLPSFSPAIMPSTSASGMTNDEGDHRQQMRC